MAHDPLSRRPELYRLTVETMVQGLALLDGRACILYANQALGRLLGYPAGELTGRPFVEFFDPVAQALLREQLERRRQGEHGYYELEYTTHDGRRLAGLISAAPLMDERGEIDCSVAVITDITARKEAEAAQLELERQLRALSAELVLAEERERRRLAGQLHDRIGHALVLAKIQLERQLTDQPAPAELAEVLQRIEQTIADARSLTFELSPPVLHELGLAAAIQWLADETAKLHGLKFSIRHSDWHRRLGEELRVLLFQATREILFNVVKHAGARHVTIELAREGQLVRLAIADDGSGFDVAVAAARSRGGSGYGLFSIAERMRHLGGSLEIESSSAGTHVTLLAPMAAEAVAPTPAAGAAPANDAQGPEVARRTDQIRLLIADDQQLMRQGIHTILDSDPQFTIVGEAATGQQALELARRERPDVVIMDIDMPEMDGLEATRVLAAEFPQLRVIALSMYADRQYVGEMLRAGATGYLLKDCAGDDLARAIRAVDGDLTFLSPAIAELVVAELLNRPRAADATLAVLTRREQQVLALLAQGQAPKEIALELGLNPKTIYTFRTSIMQKLAIDSDAELVKFAIREGLSALEP
jgi:PAS domain S-box-containing protein